MKKSTTYGYLRVSTRKQEETNFKAEILLFADSHKLGQVEWVQETVSGRVDWRKRKLGELFNTIQPGDTIIMSEYSRVGRNFLQSMEFLAECRRKKINVYSTIGDIPQVDDSTNNLLLSVKAWQNDIERETISYRTKIALQKKKEEGIKLGRKSEMVLDKNLEHNKTQIIQLLDNNVKLYGIAEKMNCTVPTLRKFIKKHNLKKTLITKT